MKLHEILAQKKSEPVTIEGIDLFFRPYTLQDLAFYNKLLEDGKNKGETAEVNIAAKLMFNQFTEESKQEFDGSFDLFCKVMGTEAYSILWEAFGETKNNSEPEKAEAEKK